MRLIREAMMRLTICNRSVTKGNEARVLHFAAISFLNHFSTYLGLPSFCPTAEKCDTWLLISSAMLGGWSIWKILGRGIERPLYADT